VPWFFLLYAVVLFGGAGDLLFDLEICIRLQCMAWFAQGLQVALPVASAIDQCQNMIKYKTQRLDLAPSAPLPLLIEYTDLDPRRYGGVICLTYPLWDCSRHTDYLFVIG
jgi:hypothetical protein